MVDHLVSRNLTGEGLLESNSGSRLLSIRTQEARGPRQLVLYSAFARVWRRCDEGCLKVETDAKMEMEVEYGFAKTLTQ